VEESPPSSPCPDPEPPKSEEAAVDEEQKAPPLPENAAETPSENPPEKPAEKSAGSGGSGEKRVRKVVTREKRVVERVVKREVEPLINRLMGYFSGEVNYTLAGYVSKIATTLFGKKPAEVVLRRCSS
jgi:hypothetical protein